MAAKNGSPEPMCGIYGGSSRHPSDLVRSRDPVHGSSKARHAAALASFERPKRSGEPKTGRGRIEAAPRKRERQKPLGPTQERLAKGDVTPYRTAGGFHRSISTVEQLRDQEKLCPENKGHNQAMFRVAERLKRHYDGCIIGVKAQDLNRVTGRGSNDDLTQEEAWVEHFRHFTDARKEMGWSPAYPNRGAACIVTAVVCEEMTVSAAATTHLRPARAEVMKAAAMDRLREGLFALAIYWREI